MRKWLFLWGLFTLMTLAGCSLPNRNVTVTTGKKIICSECSKLISYELIIIQMPYSRAEGMKPEIVKDICPACQIKKAETAIRQEIVGMNGLWQGQFDADPTLTFNDDGSGTCVDANGEQPISWYRGVTIEIGSSTAYCGRILPSGDLFLTDASANHSFFLSQSK